jgi:hypothetical protein
MLTHIRNGRVICQYNNGKGRVTLEDGGTVSPPVAGYINGNDLIVPVVEVTTDNSTTQRTTRETVETVEVDRVLRTVTISDMSIEDIRAGMSCTKMQGVLTLGEANWSKVMDFYTTDATWVQKAIIDSAANWRRTSEDLKFIGYLIGFNDEQMDALFGEATAETSRGIAT